MVIDFADPEHVPIQTPVQDPLQFLDPDEVVDEAVHVPLQDEEADVDVLEHPKHV